MSDEKPTKSIDTIGLYCPVPLFRTREAIDSIQVGDILEVYADDPAAESDIKSLIKRTGQELVSFEKNEDTLKFIIKKLK